MKKLNVMCILAMLMCTSSVVFANTVASSTMYFKGTLTDEGGGVYSGVVPMVAEVTEGIGDDVNGYDIYGKDGASANFSGDANIVIADHDGWPTWTPDTPDWYQYSLNLYDDGGVQKWAVRNHAGATETTPWYEDAVTATANGESNPDLWPREAKGVPMSGTMDWSAMYAAETDAGAYLPGTGTAKYPGWAASQGGGAAAWDMDWSWGSEVVPMEYVGFSVDINDLGGGDYLITLSPSPLDVVYVDDDYTSSTPGWGVTHFNKIQDAINAVQGSTVNVAAGVYNERVTINKSLNLLGPQAGVDPSLRTNSSAEAIITESGLSTPNPDVLIEISSGISGGVTIDGFTLEGDPTNTTADTSVIRCWANDVTIANNFIDGINGVLYKGGTGLSVTGNNFAINKIGVIVQPNPASNLAINDNIFALGSSPAGGESAIYLTSTSDSVVSGNTAAGFVNGNGVGGSNLTNVVVKGNTFDGNRKGVNFWGATTFITVCNNTIKNCTNHGINIKGQNLTIVLNTVIGNTGDGINIDKHVIDTNQVSIHYNYIDNNSGYGLNVTALVTETVEAEKNWWGTGVEADVAAMVTGNADYLPILATNQIQMAAAGNRLVESQNYDGGWDWPVANGDPCDTSSLNTIGPIGKGLIEAYLATYDSDMLPAIQKVSDLLLTKTNNFSPSDGYLAPALDAVLGGTANLDHVNTNFYGPLAAGTYDRKGEGTLYDTAGYVDLIRTARENSGIGNLAAWDIGIGVIGAASSGVSGSELDIWIQGVKDEIDELDGDAYYDVIGLAGGVYALAFVGEDFDPNAGEHAAASNLSDLADILVSYQLSTGGFTWNSGYVVEDQDNETIQETSYAVLALQAMGGYTEEVEKAAAYIKSAQSCNGGWENYAGSGENHEIAAEGAWATGPWNLLKLDVPDISQYLKPGDIVTIDMDVLKLLQEVVGCQAILNFSSTYFLAGSSDVYVQPGGGIWNELIYNVWDVNGDLDVAVGVDINSVVGTSADGTVAKFTLNVDPMAPDGVTQMVFRPDISDIESTILATIDAQEVLPEKIDSQTMVIDGTDPVVAVTSPNGGEIVKGGDSLTITWNASDLNIDYDSVKIEYYDGSAWNLIAENEDNDGSYVWDPVPSLSIDNASIRISVWDLAGNEANDVSDADFIIDSTAPVIDITSADQGGTELLISLGSTDNAVQGQVDIDIIASDPLSGLAAAPTVTVTDSAATPMTVVYDGESPTGTFNYHVTVTSTTANGTATIDAEVADNAGNSNSDNDTFNINKNQVTGSVEMDTLSSSAYSFGRDVVFKATDAGGTVLKTWTIPVSFTNNTGTKIASGTYILTDIPGNTVGVSAKTALSLRSKVATALNSNGQAVADFVAADDLIGGDLNGSNSINILDFSIFRMNWLTTNAVADINGDGMVNILDYMIFRINFFTRGDAE